MQNSALFKIFLRRLRRRSTSGSAALEFAFVAPVFFALLLGVFQAGIIFFAQETLQNAVMDAGRLIRTGQDQCFTRSANNGCQAMTGDDFFNQICNEVSALLACSSSSNNVTTSLLQYDVQSYPAGFNGSMNTSPLDASGNLPPMANFNPGNSCEVVMVRVFYKWPIEAPLLDWFLVNMANNGHLLSAAAAFRSEPFTTTSGGC